MGRVRSQLLQPLADRYPRHDYLMRGLRLGTWLHGRRVPLLPDIVRLGLLAAFSADVPFTLDLPPDVFFMHNGLGTVVHGGVRFRGPALVFHHVTIGNSYGSNEGVPEIGSYVVIGVGAAVLGNVKVGDCSLVGAGAVVTHDVPAWHVAAGNPAVLKPLDPAYIDRMFQVTPTEVWSPERDRSRRQST
jgi:serine O-acetyltransferase